MSISISGFWLAYSTGISKVLMASSPLLILNQTAETINRDANGRDAQFNLSSFQELAPVFPYAQMFLKGIDQFCFFHAILRYIEASGDGNGSPLLRHHDNQGVGGLRQSRCGPVTGSVSAGEVLSMGEGKDNPHFHNPVFGNDGRPVMDRDCWARRCFQSFPLRPCRPMKSPVEQIPPGLLCRAERSKPRYVSSPGQRRFR